MYAFGVNEWGQLGDGSLDNSHAPHPVTGLGPVSAIAAGNNHAVALLRAGVAPPLAPVSLTPEPDAARVSWTFSAPEYKVSYGPGVSEEEEEEGGRFRYTDTVVISEGSEHGCYVSDSCLLEGLGR